MSNEQVKETIEKIKKNAEYIGYIKAQNQMLHFVVGLVEQGKISREVGQLFAFEFALDLE